MRKISRNVENKILNRLLQGATYRKTASEYHVGLATLNRIVKDARRRIPDVDDLRQLNITLGKLDSTLFDVMKAYPALRKLEELEVGVEELSSFVEGMRRLAKEQKIDAADLTRAMSELAVLKTETGKSYKELVDDFKNKQVQVADMIKRSRNLRVKQQKLETDIEHCSTELRQLVSTSKNLRKLDLDKLANLVEFAKNKMKIRAELQRIRDDSERNIKRIKMELNDKKKKRVLLDADMRRLWNEREALLEEMLRLSKLKSIITKRRAFIPCKICGWEGVFFQFPSRSELMLAQINGFVWSSRCTRCGHQVQYGYWDILTYVGWLAIP